MNTCKVKFNIEKVLFPKNGDLTLGEYSIISCSLVQCLTPNFKIKLHPKYHNFSLLSYTPIVFNFYDDYIANVEEVCNQYGTSYKLISLENQQQEMTEGDKRAFLEAILTPNQIVNLYQVYSNPFDLIAKQDKEKLLQVKGIGEKAVMTLFKKYEQNLKYTKLFIELKDYNLSTALMDRLLEVYKTPEKVIITVKNNPYVLAEDVNGIGFKKADAIAMSTGMSPVCPERLEAFFNYYLTFLAAEGNSWVKPSILFGQIESNLNITYPDDTIRQVLYNMNKAGKLGWNANKTKIFLNKYYNLEEKIYNEILRLQHQLAKPYERDKELENSIIKKIETEVGFELTEEQKLAVDKILDNNVSLLVGGAGCVDKDTEFFNGVEWKKISEWETDDKVLQFNTNTNEATLTTPIRYIKEPCSKMYHFKTKYGIDQCLSPEHRVLYVDSRRPNKFLETTAEEVMQKQINNSNGFVGKFHTTFSYSGEGIELTDNEIKIMCAVICDGSFTKSNTNYCRFHIKKDRKKKELRQLFSESNIEWKESVSTAEHYSDFYIYAPRREKEFSSYWYNCNHHQLQIICDNILQWDGNINYTLNNKARRRFSTSLKKNADFIQFAFSSCGYRVSIDIRDRIGRKYYTNNKPYTRKSVEYTLTITQRNLVGMSNYYNKNYQKNIVCDFTPEDGYKYCFTVPTHALVLRRNNQIFITGNCGKTAMIRVFTQIFQARNLSVALCTLSGKASARVQEATGYESSTIHRLLKYQPPVGFTYNKDMPLSYDVVIVDESSFIGGELFYDLIQAMKDGSRLILVGDDKQLPAIGMCNIFFDMINSKVVPLARLSQIHRQAQKSGIILASKMVREGTQLTKNGWIGVETRGELQDFTLDIYNNKLYGNPKLMEWYSTFCHNLQDTFDTQIIVPMKYRGEFNTFDLNNEIQAEYNPAATDKKEIKITKNGYTYIIREGDKVINRVNNYKATVYRSKDFENNVYHKLLQEYDDFGEKIDTKQTTEIFNGYCGQVIKIIDKQIIVRFDLCEEDVVFSYSERNNLELAYALTTHLFQGSQIKNVIFALDSGSYIMNTKELLYTGITRAINKCILLTENNALRHAISTSQTNNKNTFLKELLQQKEI